MELIWNKIKNPLKNLFGNDIQHGSVFYDGDSTEQYVLVATSHDVLEFEHKKSVALCIGIDKQYRQGYAAQSLGNIVARDTKDMGEAFVTNMGFDRDQVKVCVSSAQRSDCTKRGINALFVESAKAVEQGGIFIFYFAGHGVMVGNRCVLAPADFAGKKDGISGNDLIEWLHIAECKASNVLIIFDCCHAGNLGTTLTSPDNLLKIKPGLFVMCGCAAKETCASFGALGHSIFAYFFLDYLRRHHCMTQFQVKKAMKEITELCYSFSSLLVFYNDKRRELQPCEMHPTLETLDRYDADGKIPRDEPDSGRFELVIQLFERGRPKPSPHPEVEKWLRSPLIQEALSTLYSKVTFSEALQKSILSSLLYSAASIQYAHDETPLGNRNHFLMTVTSVLGAIGYAYPEVNTTIYHLMTGLGNYRVPAKRVNTKPLDELLTEMFEVARNNKPDNTETMAGCYDTEDGGDEVDGPVVQPNATENVSDEVLLKLYVIAGHNYNALLCFLYRRCYSITVD